MTIEKLVEIADGGYPDGRIQEYFDNPRACRGDILAALIATELQETFDPDTGNGEQLLDAIHALKKAQSDISKAINALDAAFAPYAAPGRERWVVATRGEEPC
ncbi:MAG: hypothetical protein Q8R07_02190 [Candidatus Uhrbacteria bacterium]|nr:hypothetical protein [Candidatus Uhrbacteria bacterium]